MTLLLGLLLFVVLRNRRRANAARSMSASVLKRPSPKRKEPLAVAVSRPSAVKT